MSKIVCSVVIPNWNGRKFLKTCLTSLRNQSFKEFEVILVDNGSTDGSVEYVKKYFKDVRIIELDRNHGFSKAVNMGIKAGSGNFVVLLNNDTRVDKNCIKALVKVANKHSEVGFVAAKMLNFYDKTKIDSAGDYIDAVGHANNIGLGEHDGPKFNQAGYVFMVTGGGALIKREVFGKVGFLDEDYFAYFEDVDFCLRAQMQGIRGWYTPSAIIYHIHKATSNRNKPFTEYLQFRNMTMTIIKDFPFALLKKDLNWLKCLLVNLNTIRYLATKGYLKEALKAEFFILTNLHKILNKRKKIQALKKVSDEYLISNIKLKRITLFGLLRKGI